MTYCYVSNRGSSSLSVIETSSNVVVTTISLPGEVGPLAVSPNGKQVYILYSVMYETENAPRQYYVYLAVINTTSNELSSTIDLGEYLYRPNNIIAPSDTAAYVAIGEDDPDPSRQNYSIVPINVEKGVVESAISALGPWPIPMITSRDRKYLYVAPMVPGYNTPACIAVIDIASNTTLPQSYYLTYFLNGAYAMSMAIQPSTTNLYALASGYRDQVVVIDTVSNRMTYAMSIPSVGGELQGIVFSIDGRYAFVSGHDNGNLIYVLDTSSTLSSSVGCLSIVTSFTFPQNQYDNWVNMVVSPNGKYLYALSYTSLYVMDISSPSNIQLSQTIFLPTYMGPFTSCQNCYDCSEESCDYCGLCGQSPFCHTCTGCTSSSCTSCSWCDYFNASALVAIPNQDDPGLYDIYISISSDNKVALVDAQFNVTTIEVGDNPEHLVINN